MFLYYQKTQFAFAFLKKIVESLAVFLQRAAKKLWYKI